MKIQISLSNARLPKLATFLSEDSITLLQAWHGAYIKGKKPKPSMFTAKAFKQVREEFKAAGLWNPPHGEIYRGFSLSSEDFLALMRGTPLAPRTEVVSWTTNKGTALSYAKGATAKLLTFSIVVKRNASNSDILADLRDDVQRQIESADRNYEVILADAPITASMIDVVFVSRDNSKKVHKEAIATLNTLHAEGLMVDAPDPELLTYNLNSKGRLIEGV